MSFARTTELGEVKISDQVIASIITEVISDQSVSERIWPATVHGRQIGVLPKIVDAEFASNIFSGSEEDGAIYLEFSVIVKFGISIKKATKELADNIEDSMNYQLGIAPDVITINIAGVKSRHTARRNTKVVYRYDN